MDSTIIFLTIYFFKNNIELCNPNNANFKKKTIYTYILFNFINNSFSFYNVIFLSYIKIYK